jgi:hypothetical protein
MNEKNVKLPVVSAKTPEVPKAKTVEDLLNEQIKRLERLNSLAKDRDVLKVTLISLDEAFNEIKDVIEDSKLKQRFQLQFLKLHDYGRDSTKIASVGDNSTIFEFIQFLIEKVKTRLGEVEKSLLS